MSAFGPLSGAPLSSVSSPTSQIGDGVVTSSARTVIFEGGTRAVHFPDGDSGGTMANAPYKVGNGWWMDVDPDDYNFVTAIVTQDLLDRGTTITSVELIANDVIVLDGPSINGTSVIAKVTMDSGAAHSLTFRITCANTERFDRTINFKLEEH